jgi:hypothetical protein
VGWSLKQRKPRIFCGKARATEASTYLSWAEKKIAQNFCNYLEKHRSRIVNYEQLLKQQICSIGSGAVEATVKPIDRRLKISLFSMVEKKCQSNAKTSLCWPQRPVGHLRLLQNQDAPVKNSKIYCTFPDLLSNCDLDHPQS